MYKSKICSRCGKEFLPQSASQKYCKQEEVRTCIVCKKSFLTYCGSEVKTCENEQCRRLSASKGTTCKAKKCRTCGKEFYPKSPRQLDCNEELQLKCVVCGSSYTGICSKNYTNKTCSEKCRTIYTSAKQKEGWATQGRKCQLCGKEFVPTTNTQKICKEAHYRTCEVCGESFEVIITKSHYLKELPKTCSPRCKGILSARNTSIDTFKESIHNKILPRYSGHQDRAKEYIQFLDNASQFIMNHFSNTPTLKELSEYFCVSECTVGQTILKQKATQCVRYNVSSMEQEVSDYLRSICPEIVIENNTKRVITPYEIDIYLPEYKLGIECNPTCTHNSSVPMISGDPIPSSYHRMKTDMCESKGILLFHIFGYEWTYRSDIIKSMLKNLIGRNDRAIYARKCNVVELSSSKTSEFLKINHRQGPAGAKVRLGLMYGDELVSVMTFGSIRHNIGTSDSEDLSDCVELIRFCSKLNTTVVGGADKLFKHFVNKYSPTRIRSFSDRAHTKGTLYSKLGFTPIKRSREGYMWVNLKDDTFYHRTSCQKFKLKQLLKDESIDLSNTEKQIMESHGFVQVFDSGTITWEWRKSL